MCAAWLAIPVLSLLRDLYADLDLKVVLTDRFRIEAEFYP
jgi:hypothetical protein